MSDLISRQAAIEAVKRSIWDVQTAKDGIDAISNLPSAQKHGKWLEKKVIPMYESGVELQSCKCSECNRYDTRPYMYYFSEPKYCSYCGAPMEN